MGPIKPPKKPSKRAATKPPPDEPEAPKKERTRADVLRVLIEAGNPADLANQYADAFMEYIQASENIDRNGTVCQDPRTGRPMENPFLKIRDKALAKMHGRGLRRVKASSLWSSEP